jgi:chromosome segregation ATPase
VQRQLKEIEVDLAGSRSEVQRLEAHACAADDLVLRLERQLEDANNSLSRYCTAQAEEQQKVESLQRELQAASLEKKSLQDDLARKKEEFEHVASAKLHEQTIAEERLNREFAKQQETQRMLENVQNELRHIQTCAAKSAEDSDARQERLRQELKQALASAAQDLEAQRQRWQRGLDTVTAECVQLQEALTAANDESAKKAMLAKV